MLHLLIGRWSLPVHLLQGKLEALSMPAAISYLEAAWSTAYKVIGTEATTAKTLDMISGESHNPTTCLTPSALA